MPLQPARDQGIKNLAVEFVWSAVNGAVYYTVEIATDEYFQNPIAGSPFFVRPDGSYLPNKLRLDRSYLSVARYFWRVRASVTPAGAYGKSSFIAYDDAVFLYCPDSALTCEDGSAAYGTKSAPFRTFGAAMNAASNLGINVKVARRGGTSAYPGPWLIRSNVSIFGGHEASADWARDVLAYPTIVSSSIEYVIKGADLTENTAFTVSGLTIKNGADSSVTESRTIDLSNISGRLTLEGIKIGEIVWPSNRYGISAQNISNLVLQDLDFTGAGFQKMIYANASRVTLRNSNFSFSGTSLSSSISGLEFGGTASSCVLDIANSAISMPQADVFMATVTLTALAINGCSGQIRDSNFTGNGGADNGANVRLVRIDNSQNLQFSGNTLTSGSVNGATSFSRLLEIFGGSNTIVSNNTLTVPGIASGAISIGLHTQSINTVSITQNTFTGASTSAKLVQLNSQLANTTVTNNTFSGSAAVGIEALASEVTFLQNSMAISGPATQVFGVVYDATGGIIAQNTLQTTANGQCQSVRIVGTHASPVTIERNRISTGTSLSHIAAVRLSDTGTLYIRNNLIFPGQTGGASTRVAILDAHGKIYNNTLYAGASSTSSGITLPTIASDADIRNNIIFGGASSTCIRESSASGDPAIVRNNNLACPNVYFDENSTAITGMSTTVSTQEGSNTLAAWANIYFDNTGDQLFLNQNGTDGNLATLIDNNWALNPTADVAVLTGGQNGATTANSFGFSVDFSGNSRSPLDESPLGWSMGAYEQ